MGTVSGEAVARWEVVQKGEGPKVEERFLADQVGGQVRQAVGVVVEASRCKAKSRASRFPRDHPPPSTQGRQTTCTAARGYPAPCPDAERLSG